MNSIALILVATLSGGVYADVVLKGFDPVLLCEGRGVPGLGDLEATHGSFTYRFSEPETRERFRADPERWGIQWGGGCGRMGPLSGTGSVDRWAVHDGRIFIFASDACREGFASAPERFLAAPPELPEHDEAARTTGAEWIEKAVLAHGGEAALDSGRFIRLIHTEESGGWKNRTSLLLAHTGELERRSAWTSPDSEKPPSQTTWVVTERPFVDDGTEVRELTSPEQLDDLRRLGQREVIPLLWQRRRADFVAQYVGSGELGGRAVENVLVQLEGLITTLHIDPETHLIAGLSWRGRLFEGGTRQVVETVTSWTIAGDTVLPIQRSITLDGEEQPALAIAWNAVEILPEAPSTAYERRR